jgi:hypothetical protein
MKPLLRFPAVFQSSGKQLVGGSVRAKYPAHGAHL